GRPGTQPGRPRWYLNYPLRRGITFTIFRYPLRCLVNFAQTGISAATYRHFPPLPAISRHQHGFIIRQAAAALPTARAAQIHIISLKLRTKEAAIDDSIEAAVAGSTPSGAFSAASLVSFDRSLLCAPSGIGRSDNARFRWLPNTVTITTPNTAIASSPATRA